MKKKYQVIIEPHITGDIQKIINYYKNESKSSALGKRFFDNFEKQKNILEDNAKVFSIKYQNIRCVGIPKFPFSIHYEVNEKKLRLTILAVFHTSQNPKKWLND